jgi:hypothetical protein
MNLKGKKLDILNKLKMLTSMEASISQELINAAESTERFVGEFNSLKRDNKDTVEFLIDLMVITLGTVFLEKTLNKVMSNMLKKDGETGNVESGGTGNTDGAKVDLELSLKTNFLKVLKLDDDQKLFPAQFLGSGYDFPVKLLDLFDIFMTNPNTPAGSMLYGSDNSNFLRQFMTQVIQTGTVASFNSIIPDISFQFMPGSSVINIKGTMSPTETVNAYFERMMMSPNFKVIDRKKLVVDIVDAVISTLAKHKSKRALKAEEMIDELVKSIDEEEDGDEYSVFTPEWFNQSQNRVNTRKEGGYTADLGCSIVQFNLEPEELDAIANALDINSALDNVMEAKFKAEGVDYNAPVKENLKRNIIKAIVSAILRNTLFAPQIWMMVLLSRAFKKGYNQSDNTKYIISTTGDLDIRAILYDNKAIVKEITRIVKRILIKQLSNIVLKKIAKMIVPIQVEIYKEQMAQYTGVMKSLNGGQKLNTGFIA